MKADVAELTLHHPGGETPILLGPGAWIAAAPRLERWAGGRLLFVLSTPRVLALHGAALDGLRAGCGQCVVLEVDEGEPAKDLLAAGRLWDAMLEAGGKRDSRLLAFGGGSVGDLGGFVAGCFLRGISFAQAPTTLLAQADAAIGGKTAIDRPAAKNSVGLFHHPALVVAETAFLSTLPAEELRSGLVEVIKVAILLDPALLAELERDLDALLHRDLGPLAAAVRAAAAVKVKVVAADPGERDQRKLLNLGHTLGHAIEAALGYQGLRHGEAVAYGILFAFQLAVARGCEPALARRSRDLLRRLALPPLPPLAPERVLRLMARDKKARSSGIEWVLPEALGSGRIVSDVSAAEVEAILPAFLSDPWILPV